MTAHLLKSGLQRLAAGALLSLAAVSCAPVEYYSGNSPDGGHYVRTRAPSWRMPEWGMVKLPTPKLPGFMFPGRDPAYSMYWRGEGVEGKPRIHIKISEQRAYYYKGDQLVGESPVCTGSPDFPTPRGNFSVIEKDEDHLSSAYGNYVDSQGNVVKSQVDSRKDRRPPGTRFDGARMNYFMRVTGAVGMHEGYLPGYADSHGCIRLPGRMAKVFYENTPLGTPVKITQ